MRGTLVIVVRTLLLVKSLPSFFPIKKGFLKRTVDYFKAVDNISFSLNKGTTLGIVGESGSGKTTLAQAILKLVPADGIINYKNKVFDKNNNAFFRRNIQFVFQDPFSSLSPRLSIYEIISEGLEINKIGKNTKNRE